MAKITAEFVGTLQDETKVAGGSLAGASKYTITAKGDLDDLRTVLPLLHKLGHIDELRLSALLKFLPQGGTAQERIPYAYAQPLSQTLGGYAGAVQRLLDAYAKDKRVVVDGEEWDTTRWNEIIVDISIQRFEETTFGMFLSSLSIGNAGGIGLTDAEWKAISTSMPATEANLRVLGSAAAATTQALVSAASVVAKKAGENLPSVSWWPLAVVVGGTAVGLALYAVLLKAFVQWLLSPRAVRNPATDAPPPPKAAPSPMPPARTKVAR